MLSRNEQTNQTIGFPSKESTVLSTGKEERIIVTSLCYYSKPAKRMLKLLFHKPLNRKDVYYLDHFNVATPRKCICISKLTTFSYFSLLFYYYYYYFLYIFFQLFRLTIWSEYIHAPLT